MSRLSDLKRLKSMELAIVDLRFKLYHSPEALAREPALKAFWCELTKKFGLTKKVLLSRDSKHGKTEVRYIAALFLKEYGEWDTRDIGIEMGGVHTSAYPYIDEAIKMRDTNDDFRGRYWSFVAIMRTLSEEDTERGRAILLTFPAFKVGRPKRNYER